MIEFKNYHKNLKLDDFFIQTVNFITIYRINLLAL